MASFELPSSGLAGVSLIEEESMSMAADSFRLFM